MTQKVAPAHEAKVYTPSSDFSPSHRRRPVLVVEGHILHDGIRAARVSTFEVHQQLRLNGHGSWTG